MLRAMLKSLRTGVVTTRYPQVPSAPPPPIPAEQVTTTDARENNPADDPPLGPEPLDQPGETPIELLVRVLGAHVIAETPRRRRRVH